MSVSPTPPIPTALGELLILMGAPNEIFNIIVPAVPGLVPFSVPIPNSSTLLGTKWYTQGICPDMPTGFFSNALDAVVDNF